jgi:hypothetical protein
MKQFVLYWFSLVFIVVLAGAAASASLFSGNSERRAIVDLRPHAGDGELRASLFADRQGGSLFEPIVRELAPEGSNKWAAGVSRPGVAGLRDLIAKAEAGSAGYDAVVWSARIKTPKPPTQMTIGEIYQWIEDTPGQNHAIGRYQFIPSTLRRVVSVVGVPRSARFTPEVQDKLAHVLLEDAGLSRFKAGQMARQSFMNNLAKIWAGLPNSTGKSHYHGFAGNKATMTWARFEAAMTRIFPG